ncbi:deubiquitinating enzyme [Blastocladiella emersonii ATCC 22665]|nr:deubiquitinating enzyme [Blastocladiella emersonii ATCC 22665]
MKVSVKWTTQKYDVELDESQPPIVFKTVLYSLSGVSPDRQKLLLKGVQVKDDDEWTKFKGLKDGASFLMMGTVGELPKAPETKPTFIEDLKPGQSATLTRAPVGLTNLGNTCYMNATLQCLRQVREMQAALEADANRKYSQDTIGNVAVALRDLYKQLNAPVPTDDAVPPLAFLAAFRTAYPQFAQQEPRSGQYAQQDAEEAWNQLLTAVKAGVAPPKAGDAASADSSSSLEKLMGVEFTNTTTCDDPAAAAAGEMETTTATSDLRMTCHISAQVNNVQQSIAESLVQKLEKNSAALGRTASYTVKAQVARLPKYLTIHFARFFWRADIKQRVKIRRNVAYSTELDMYKYCTPELQDKLRAKRDGGNAHPDLAADATCNKSGVYELCAVLTHIGASSDSGHYIAWAKDGKDWFKFDDDKVSPVTEADVLKNSGSSADGHIAYLLLYRAKEE